MSNVWLPGVVEQIALYLDGNEVPCTLRLVDKATARQFAHHVHVRLSQPVPHHAFQSYWTKPDVMRPFSCNQRRMLLVLTSASGCLANLEVAFTHAGIDLASPSFLLPFGSDFNLLNPLAAAAAAGHIHICEWLHQQGCLVGWLHLPVAAKAGRLEACAWLLDHGCPWTTAGVYAAVRGGHPDLAEWLSSRRPAGEAEPRAKEVLAAAPEGCDLATLQRLHWKWLRRVCGGEWWQLPQQLAEQPPQHQEEDPSQQPPLLALPPPQQLLALPPPQQLLAQQQVEELTNYQRMCILACAVRSHTPDWRAKVVWLESQGCPPSPLASQAAASCPDAVERLHWLVQRGYPLSKDAVEAAAEMGNVGALQFLLSIQDIIEPRMGPLQSISAICGHLSAMQMLHAHGLLPDVRQCVHEALRGGHLAVVAWLLEEADITLSQLRQISNEPRAFSAAACKVDMLDWLHARGCYVKENALLTAAKAGREEVIEWLLDHGYRFPVNGTPYNEPIERGDLATLRCLRRLGCPWGTGKMTLRPEKCCQGVLALLNELGLPYKLVSYINRDDDEDS